MDRTILDVLRTDPDISTEKLVAKALEVILYLSISLFFSELATAAKNGFAWWQTILCLDSRGLENITQVYLIKCGQSTCKKT